MKSNPGSPRKRSKLLSMADEEVTEDSLEFPFSVITIMIREEDGRQVVDARGYTPGDLYLICKKIMQQIDQETIDPDLIFDSDDVTLVEAMDRLDAGDYEDEDEEE